MTKVLESLYDYILDNTLELYYKKTDYEHWRQKRDSVGRELWEQISLD